MQSELPSEGLLHTPSAGAQAHTLSTHRRERRSIRGRPSPFSKQAARRPLQAFLSNMATPHPTQKNSERHAFAGAATFHVRFPAISICLHPHPARLHPALVVPQTVHKHGSWLVAVCPCGSRRVPRKEEAWAVTCLRARRQPEQSPWTAGTDERVRYQVSTLTQYIC